MFGSVEMDDSAVVPNRTSTGSRLVTDLSRTVPLLDDDSHFCTDFYKDVVTSGESVGR
jgi:hypothetical protein